ncbi:hypothetical protein ACX3T8_07835 [Corynebacterium pyruviciproducens]
MYTIDDASASHEKTFDFNLPPEGEIVTEDGFFYVAFDGVKKIRFSVPWAIDAEGNSLNTWFTTDGKRLTQHVQFDENTAFPVKADPRMNWGIVSGHVYFDKEETKKAGLLQPELSRFPRSGFSCHHLLAKRSEYGGNPTRLR